MASRIFMFVKKDFPFLTSRKSNILPSRCRVTTETGAFLPEPVKTQFGLLRVLFTVLPGLYLGATISKEGAAFLEENDIFVPDEDDDED